MRLICSARFLRAYQKLSQAGRRQTDKTLRQLEADPHHPSLRTHKRRGEGAIWQTRITREYRLYFLMQGDTITLLHVGPHAK